MSRRVPQAPGRSTVRLDQYFKAASVGGSNERTLDGTVNAVDNLADIFVQWTIFPALRRPGLLPSRPVAEGKAPTRSRDPGARSSHPRVGGTTGPALVAHGHFERIAHVASGQDRPRRRIRRRAADTLAIPRPRAPACGPRRPAPEVPTPAVVSALSSPRRGVAYPPAGMVHIPEGPSHGEEGWQKKAERKNEGKRWRRGRWRGEGEEGGKKGGVGW